MSIRFSISLLSRACRTVELFSTPVSKLSPTALFPSRALPVSLRRGMWLRRHALASLQSDSEQWQSQFCSYNHVSVHASCRHHCCCSFRAKQLMQTIQLGGTDMKTAKTWLWILVTTAGLIEFGGCNSSATGPYANAPASNGGNSTNSSPNTVVMNNMAFGSSTLTVPKGTTVTWQNNDSVPHTATSDTGAWDSGNIPPGESKSVIFTTTGTFPYHCTVHPMMTATIVVQ